MTLTTDGWILTIILVSAIGAFAWGRIRPELVAIAAMLACGLTKVLRPEEAFSGFSDPTVITIAAMFVVSAGVERTGVAALVARSILRLLGTGELVLTIALMLLSAALAGFTNVIASVAVLLPVAVAVCREARISPSRLLMPLAIGGRLGGALTLVGKPSNLIVNSLLVEAGHRSLSFFSFFPVGVALVVVGTAFFVLFGRRVLPARMPEDFMWSDAFRGNLEDTYRLPERLFRLRVAAGSPLAGRTVAEAGLGKTYGIIILSIDRGRQHNYAPRRDEPLSPGDELLIEARPEEVDRLRALGSIDVVPDGDARRRPLETEDIGLAEVVVAPRSDFAGKTLKEMEFRQRYGLNVVAIWREGRPRRTWLAELPLEYGDALLLQGPRERIRFLRFDPNFVSFDKPRPLRRSRAPFAVLAMGTLVVLGVTGAVPVSLAAMLAAGIVVAAGCVSPRESFEVVDWPTVVVIGGLLPLGAALHSTGAAQAIADAMLPLLGQTPLMALAAVLLAAVAVGYVVPSVPSTILMAPIGLSAAAAIGASPVPFMIAVATATSITLLTPISHPVSLMVMGPGGYRFSDYTRVGAPLAAMLFVTALVVIRMFWPL
jgi:di/tricarboxylate transporter